jgi:hypothetical protein
MFLDNNPLNEEEKKFIAKVKKQSLETKGINKTFYLTHEETHPNSILSLEVENYEAAKNVMRQIYGNGYDEKHFDRQEGFRNDKIVNIHFVIHKM